MTRLSGQDVARAVAGFYKMSVVELVGQGRQRHVARPRQVAMYAMRHLCPHLSTPAIGRVLGGRDHSTILHGLRTVDGLLSRDADFRQEVRLAIEAVTALDRPVQASSATADFAALLPFPVLCAGYAAAMGGRAA